MATIMEGAQWTLTEAAAERMVENGLLTKCTGDHTEQVIADDLPIYHRACDAPSWFGFSTMHQAIRAAEAHVVNREQELMYVQFHDIWLDTTANPEPGGLGSITVVEETPDAAES